ncbi:hypothetical protein SmJEL517_g01245 [Synchytrium microbalum]|uniref:Homeobox domain-containing protein n=1 Tax=Synchytrium microbalum TaxID=1806994 RepID=A0A507C631_9FUNG|nr:uncharacterized protein SmJEL517_g01245 [Synchytrium microbalum]TPX36487.1 hypothetical protein SmJEL517_g01245 [Synchytrium microbalum]
MSFDYMTVFQARSLNIDRSLELDIMLAQLLSPMLATPVFESLNSMEETSNLSLSLPDNSSEWSEYLGKDLITGQTFCTSDLEIPVLEEYSSPAANEEGSSCQTNSNSEMQTLEASIAWTLDSVNGATHAILTAITMVNPESSNAYSSKIGSPNTPLNGSASPVYDAMEVASQIFSRRDSGVDFEPYIPLNKDVLRQPVIEEEASSASEDSNSSNDSDDEYDADTPRKQAPALSRKRRSSATAGNGRITKPFVRVLSKVFEQTCYPETSIRELLAERMDMKPRAVQIWFQNKRQHLKAAGVSEGLRTKKGGDNIRVDQLQPEDVEMWCAEVGF